MKSKIISLLLFLLPALFASAQKQKLPKEKLDILNSIEARKDELIKLSDQIWLFAETALSETKSSSLLAEYAEKNGFQVARSVAEMPTAFIASYGSGKPIIGILGEFDALPGLSQKAQPIKESLKNGSPGHGCGHNLLGVAGLGTAIAIKDLISKGILKGTIRYYGTPAEETIGGKIYMARAGLFNDLDICLDWHPEAKIESGSQSTQALIDFTVHFKGKAAHAAFDPWNGASAVDALEFYTNGLNYLREHVKPTVRIHYLIEKAGDVVNVVPENAKIWTRVRDSKREGVLLVYERAKKIAEGAAIMAGVEWSFQLISGWHEVLVIRSGAELMQKNLDLVGPVQYSDKETEFAKAIQQNTDKDQFGLDGTVHPLERTREDPPGGSTDVGDVSWIVPEIRFSVTTAPKGTPWHSWAVVACAGMSIGHKGMLHASKAMAFTAYDLFFNEQIRATIKKEFETKRGNYQYKPMLPEGPPPVPILK
jgi:aminobenzoyl-glutamate utilization protein B